MAERGKLPAYSNALAIPTDPKELAQFAKTGNLKVSAAKKLIKTHNFQAKEDIDQRIFLQSNCRRI